MFSRVVILLLCFVPAFAFADVPPRVSDLLEVSLDDVTTLLGLVIAGSVFIWGYQYFSRVVRLYLER